MSALVPLTGGHITFDGSSSLTPALLPELPDTPRNAQITEKFGTVPLKWRITTDLWRRNPNACKRCDSTFYEFENMGRWKCWQHAAPHPVFTHSLKYGTRSSAAVWPCCNGRGERAKGCVPADHIGVAAPSANYNEWDATEIPPGVWGLFRDVFPDTQHQADHDDDVHVLQADTSTRVQRYDVQKSAELSVGSI